MHVIVYHSWYATPCPPAGLHAEGDPGALPHKPQGDGRGVRVCVCVYVCV